MYREEVRGNDLLKAKWLIEYLHTEYQDTLISSHLSPSVDNPV